MPDRPVKLTTLFNLLRRRGPIPVLGLVFTFSALFILLPSLGLVVANIRKPYEQYDYEVIKRDGSEQTARIMALDPMTNVSYNRVNPTLITYTYPQGGQLATDHFETMDTAGVAALQTGDTIRIKVQDGESVIPSLEPFAFPVWIFFMLPLIFFVLGAVFLLIGLGPVLREYNLYKTGVAGRGILQGITSRNAGFRNTRQTWLVSYTYPATTGQPLLGESITDDFLLVQEKHFGDPVDLLLAPTDETRSCLVPRLEAIRNNWHLA